MKTFQVGDQVRVLREFYLVPSGSRGIISEEYDTGYMVDWDKRDVGYDYLRDGFNKKTELHYLEKIV